MSKIRKILGLSAAVLVLAVGMGGQASAAATFLICGYQEVDGTAQWETRYVYPATRKCPATSIKDGREGALVYQEILAW